MTWEGRNEFDAIRNTEQGGQLSELFDVAGVPGRLVANHSKLHTPVHERERLDQRAWDTSRDDAALIHDPRLATRGWRRQRDRLAFPRAVPDAHQLNLRSGIVRDQLASVGVRGDDNRGTTKQLSPESQKPAHELGSRMSAWRIVLVVNDVNAGKIRGQPSDRRGQCV